MRTRDPKINRLSDVPLFAGLSRRELTDIAACSDEFERDAGVDLIREGSTGREAFVVLEGNVAVWRGGNEVAVVGPGAVIGEVAVVGEGRRNASVVTLTSSRLLAFAAQDLRRAMAVSPGFARRIEASARERSAPVPA